ncbi:MAG: DUF5711 family protein [Lachnospiraceae bacterium]|nr:DUF5711 family protein [Lachnospiraceae bacterium]
MRETEERDYEQEYEEVPRRGRGPVFACIFLGITVLALVIVLIVKARGDYTRVELTSERKILSSSKVMGTESGFCAYNRDGAEGYSDNLNTLWNISYDFIDPIGRTSGDKCVFADRGGTDACVTDNKGTVTNLRMPGLIREACISETGVSAFLCDDGEEDYIYLYNFKGEKLLEIKTDVRSMGFPVTIALSPDGKRLVTSYIVIEEEQSCRITFYNFGEVGQNYSDKIVGSFSYPDEIIPYLTFIDSEYICICAEYSARIFRFRELPEEITHIDYDGSIEGIDVYDDTIAIASREVGSARLIRLYDKGGELLSSAKTNIDFDEIRVRDGEIFITCSDAFLIYDKEGNEKIRTTIPYKIEAVFPTGDSDRYMIAVPGKVFMGQLVRGPKEEPEGEEEYIDDPEDESIGAEDESIGGDIISDDDTDAMT